MQNWGRFGSEKEFVDYLLKKVDIIIEQKGYEAAIKQLDDNVATLKKAISEATIE